MSKHIQLHPLDTCTRWTGLNLYYAGPSQEHEQKRGETEIEESAKRRQQGSNLRGRSPTDFKSVSLTTRTYRRCCDRPLRANLFNKIFHVGLKTMYPDPNKPIRSYSTSAFLSTVFFFWDHFSGANPWIYVISCVKDISPRGPECQKCGPVKSFKRPQITKILTFLDKKHSP